MEFLASEYPADTDPPRPISPLVHIPIIALALAGGALGIAGAFVGEARAGGFILVIVIGAPVIEEAFKPIGVFLALVWFARAMRNRIYVATLCAMGGLVFGLIESAVYVWIYAPDHPEWFVWFRFLVTAPLHALFSFTVGLGLDRRVVDWASRGTPLPKRTLRFYIAGVAMHAAYNTTVVILALGFGEFDF